jgi:N-methylhydantoinase B
VNAERTHRDSPAVDPIVFEIIRHRLDMINEDAADTLIHVSGSQIAVEASDLNAVITDARGEVLACGKYILAQVVSIQNVINDIVENYTGNPGIAPGDQFITNDPYIGTLHQADVVVVAPVFDGDELIAWSGSTVHQSDVGGPVSGGINYASRSIFDEALPMPPLKLVEGGRVRRDIEREYLCRSRTPELNALDMLGQIAANRMAGRELLELCRQFGQGVVTAAMEQLLDGSERRFRTRLADLPDGRFRHETFLEHEGFDGSSYVPNSIYAVRLTMTKIGDSIELDFCESDDQAPGGINAAIGALSNYAIAAVMIYLAGGLPWVPGAIQRAVVIKAREGSVVKAKWPAGVAMATGGAVHAIRTCVNVCVSRLLDSSSKYERLIVAPCESAGGGGGNISGTTAAGFPFGTVMLDEISGGGGATNQHDGPDTSGLSTSPGASPANIEVNETYYPVLYTCRRELTDSGGPGTQRGGVGAMHVFRAHRSPHPIEFLSFGQGLQHSLASGVAGGEPGSPSVFSFMAAEAADIAGGAGLDRMGRDLPVGMPTTRMVLAPTHAYLAMSQGGGGYGDPLDRDPLLVLEDVRDGLVSIQAARDDYGVMIIETPSGSQVDLIEVDRVRRLRREHRIGRAARTGAAAPPHGTRLSSAFTLIESEDGSRICCSRCGADLCSAAANVHDHLVVDERPAHDRWPVTGRVEGSHRFRNRHYFCPGCGTQVDVTVAVAGSPNLWAIEVLAPIHTDVGAERSPADCSDDVVRRPT